MKILKRVMCKLKLVKLEKIDLTELKYNIVQCGDYELGDSTNTFRNKRFVLNGKKEIFKTYDGMFGQNIRNFRMNSEIICYYVGKQIGVECAKVRHAKYQNYEGTISEVSLKTNEVLITGNELLSNFCKDNDKNSLESYEKYFSFASNLKKYNINQKQLTYNLFKMCVFDYLTVQQDRHAYNIHFVKKVVSGKVFVYFYPLIDCEYAFAGFTYGRQLINQGTNGFKEEFDTDNNRLSIYSASANKYGFICDAKKEVKDLVDYALTKPECMEFLRETLVKFNLKSIIDKLKAEGMEISEQEELWRISLCEEQKKKLKEEIEKERDMDLVTELQNAIGTLGRNRNI